ncbi:hybrid sensor histidine kinase/response regulator [Puteibacter caeruleilacunae]|nr:hybrid sensor histidine kinase/response regulator [Puteibacter caeruleilacunae]
MHTLKSDISYKKFLNAILTALIISIGFSSSASINLRRITPAGGLSFNEIHDITKDNYGYLWIASSEGLFQYNSKRFINYRHTVTDSLSLIDDRIQKLHVAKDSSLYIGTHSGLCIHNYKKNNFHKIPLFDAHKQRLHSPNIHDIAEDSSGKIWIIADGKIFCSKASYFYEVDLNIPNLTTIHFGNIDKSIGWLGDNRGNIFKFNPFKKKGTRFYSGKKRRIISIYSTSERIIIGYLFGGATSVSLANNSSYQYRFETNSWKLSNENVRDILADKFNNIWFATSKGIFIDQHGQLLNYTPNTHKDMPHRSIWCLYKDSADGIWLGTWSSGVAYSHPNDNTYYTFHHDQSNNSLSSNMVSSFVQTMGRDILVGSDAGGLDVFNTSTHTFKNIKLKVEKQYETTVKSLVEDKVGNIFVGTTKAAFLCPQNTYNYKPIQLHTNRSMCLPGINVHSLCAVDSGTYVGFRNHTTYFYNTKSKTIHPWNRSFPHISINSSDISHILSTKNTLYFATLDQGLYIFSNDTLPKLVHYNAKNSNISSNSIYFLYQSSNNEIWLGTKSHGISIYDPQTNTFREEDLDGAIKGLDVYGIIQDNHNRYWITTNNGIYSFDQNKEEIRHLTKEDGIQGNLFTPKAILKDHKGNLYFGGTNGFTVIDPKKLKTNNVKPNVLIHNIVVNHNTNINYFSLDRIDSIAHLKLNANETDIRFDFSADNYLLPEKNQFKYRLKGHSEQWVDCTKESSAIFTNLSDGEYTFEVKACNNDQVWNDKPLKIRITIATPLWRSTWALLAYFIFITAILYAIAHFFKERHKLKQQVERERMEKENQKELSEMKLRLFTNISHELRTPLTLISGPLQILNNFNHIPVKVQSYIDVMNRNTNRLLALVNQILELRKLESGKSELKVSSFNLFEFIEERYLSFIQLAMQKGINYQFQFNLLEPEIIEADKDKLDKIIVNLLANAFKYTPANGSIILTIDVAVACAPTDHENEISFGTPQIADAISILITDTGKGISKLNLPTIFNRFEQGENAASGTGIGLELCKEYTLLHNGNITAASTLQKGSCFSLQLPLRQENYSSDQSEIIIPDGNIDLDRVTALTKETKADTTILIVEDNLDLQAFIIDILSSHYQTLQASNGHEALKIVSSQSIDLVLSDVMMPEMDGMELCNKIKSNVVTSHIPVILLTALNNTKNQLQGFTYGADAYLTKPFDPQILLGRIENLLLQRQRLQAYFNQGDQPSNSTPLNDIDNQFITKVQRLIQEHLSDEHLSTEDLAYEAGLSRSQLHRKIKSLTGQSTSEFMRIVKLNIATDLLTKTDLNITEIAFKSGFTSHAYFSKSFKDHFKMSPKLYKEKYTPNKPINDIP